MENSFLKSADLKQTKKRNLILSVMEKADHPLTVDGILKLTSKDMKMSVSTIYRALNALTEKNILIKTIHQDGKMYFRMNRHTHHHSLTCTVCHDSIIIDACPLESLKHHLAQTTDYCITGHNLEFYGVCPKCKKRLSK